ncbi:hypothetical protein BA011_21340 [Rhizobium leguminosarum]|uniref:Uncharacterized protein n=1 Tax=Rhizobium leguminosarum TaxID=384 RepID=A0A1B1CE08_RHILE|nr:hypothetical protein BA011_21340 [Rhizobium leguminosarum]
MQPRKWHGAPHSTSWTLLKSVRAPMETRDRVAEATLHLSVAVQAGTAGQYRSNMAIRSEDDCSFAWCAYSPHRVAK